MVKLYTIAAIRQLEELAYTQLNLTPYDLMQRAGQAAFQIMLQKWPRVTTIAVFCGNGNNGGDGYVLAYLAKTAGLQVQIWQVGSLSKLPEPAREAYLTCLAAGMVMQPFTEQAVIDADLIIDALLGTGIKGLLRTDYNQAIERINQVHKPVLAIDIPSGLDADTGTMTCIAVKADLTVTFIGFKQGLLTGAAVDCCGEIICHSLNIPDELYNSVSPSGQSLSLKTMQALLAKRPRNVHKGDFGRVLVIGGNYGMGGAVRMAGEAAARIGAGLVTLATRPEHVAAINAARPELLCYGISKPSQLKPLLAKATVLALGPGLGQDRWAQALWQLAIACPKPKVMDADALNLLAKKPFQGKAWVLTPHPGEAARLLNLSAQAIQADRYTAIAQLQQRYGGVIILKGAGSLVRIHNHTHLCTAGNPGMASAGMGDVLTGIIAGLMAQGLSLQDAANAGVMFHAQAGDKVAIKQGERGLLALDLLAELPRLVNN
ncbi:MAG: hypothetical protein K0S11_450 [Gammaproteobacteria bacterium]|nr:hypothetical protein [Gammaproteobacteria bacterium]